MRILVLTSSYPRFPGDGVAPFVRSISEHLAAVGHDVEVIAPYDPIVSNVCGTVPVHRFRYAPVRAWHIMGHARSLQGDTRLRVGAVLLLPLFLAAYFIAVWKVARRMRPDLIYAHWVLPSGLVGALISSAFRIPFALSLHGSDVYLALRTPVFGRVAGGVFRRAAVITACSEPLRQGAIDLGADPDRVHLLAWGADPERFSPRVQPLARAEFGLGEDDLVVLSLGRMVPKKGFDVLVSAFALLPSDDLPIHLVLGGDGSEAEGLRTLAESLGIAERVHLPGQIAWDDVPSFLAMGDVFVLPSVRDKAGNMDGLPTVLLEAMATGKPVVATELAGVPLVLTDDVNGTLCPPGDPAALAQAIASVVRNPDIRQRLGHEARGSVEARFNWYEVARQLTALFSDSVNVARGVEL